MCHIHADAPIRILSSDQLVVIRFTDQPGDDPAGLERIELFVSEHIGAPLVMFDLTHVREASVELLHLLRRLHERCTGHGSRVVFCGVCPRRSSLAASLRKRNLLVLQQPVEDRTVQTLRRHVDARLGSRIAS